MDRERTTPKSQATRESAIGELLGTLVERYRTERAEACNELTAELFDRPVHPHRRGASTLEARATRDAVLRVWQQLKGDYGRLGQDRLLHRYISNLALRAAREGVLTPSANLRRMEAFVEFAVTSFQLLREARFPNSFIKTLAHNRSLSEIDSVCRETERLFGADPATKGLQSHVVQSVLSQRKRSVDEVHAAFCRLHQEAREFLVQHTGKEDERLALRLAKRVFTRNSKSLSSAYRWISHSTKSSQTTASSSTDINGLHST